MSFKQLYMLVIFLGMVPMVAMGQVQSESLAGKAQPSNERLQTLDTVVVTGSTPGPGMWRVTKGDHELWVFGTMSPLPAAIEWNAQPVLDVVSTAQVVLWSPYFTVDVKAGFFKKLSLGYGYWKAQKNPDGRPLKEILPPETYARWLMLKRKYMPSDGGVERKRPVIAADALLDAAIKHAGLSRERIVVPPVMAAAKAANIKTHTPRYVLSLSDADAKRILQDAKSASMDDDGCLVATMDVVEQYLPRLITNANAWATGDIERISLDQLERRDQLCTDAFSNTDFSRKHGIPNIQDSVMDSWMKTAKYALEHNQTTVAFLPIGSVMRSGGYIDRLRSEGFEVEAP